MSFACYISAMRRPLGTKHPPLTELQYELVHELKSKEMKTLPISIELNLPLQQVNYAFLSPTYAYYRDNEAKMTKRL